MPLDAKIEAILFWKSAPMTFGALAKILEVSENDIQEGVANLEKKLDGRGVQLIVKEDEVVLGTRSEISPLIEKLAKEEITKDLGKAGLETLSIVLYKGPVTRKEIDYIRGVNSNFILRNLLVRGLVEKVPNPNDERSFLYKPTFELFAYLGIQTIDELPEYAEVRAEIDTHNNESEK